LKFSESLPEKLAYKVTKKEGFEGWVFSHKEGLNFGYLFVPQKVCTLRSAWIWVKKGINQMLAFD